jgi:hypothetical protein
MDSTLAELAVSGAQAIVKLMATDAWEGAKKLVARIFSSRPEAVQQEFMQALDASRVQLAASPDPGATLEEHEKDRLEAELRLRLLQEPAVASIIADILELARATEAVNGKDVASIMIKAEAHDNARVYQQGSGIQHNG